MAARRGRRAGRLPVARGEQPRPADRVVLLGDRRGECRRHGLAVGPGRALDLRLARGRARARWRGDERDDRRGHGARGLECRYAGVALAGRGRLPRAGGRGHGLLVDDRPLPLGPLHDERAGDGLGGCGLRRGRAHADAGEPGDGRGREGDDGRPVARDGDGRAAWGGAAGTGRGRPRACGQVRRDGGAHFVREDRGPGCGGGGRDPSAPRPGRDLARHRGGRRQARAARRDRGAP